VRALLAMRPCGLVVSRTRDTSNSVLYFTLENDHVLFDSDVPVDVGPGQRAGCPGRLLRRSLSGFVRTVLLRDVRMRLLRDGHLHRRMRL
jgi:hypothetical protein